jgi:hypothetical protein
MPQPTVTIKVTDSEALLIHMALKRLEIAHTYPDTRTVAGAMAHTVWQARDSARRGYFRWHRRLWRRFLRWLCESRNEIICATAILIISGILGAVLGLRWK